MASNNSSSRLEVVLGSGHLRRRSSPPAEDVRAFTDTFRSHGHVRIGTAAVCLLEEPGASERMLATSGATAWCMLDTKVLSMGKGIHSRENVLKCMEQSLKNLGFDGDSAKGEVDITYLHMPALDTPLEETVGAMNEGFQWGWFKRFGCRIIRPSTSRRFVRLRRAKDVYQGQYNPIARAGEKDLFPVLREYGLSFFAYSPTGAGFFSGKVGSDSFNRPEGRFAKSTPVGHFFDAIYLRPELLALANKVHTKATEHGFTGHEAALRWCLHHSVLSKDHGDGVIVGAGTLDQLKDNVKACAAGLLPAELVKVFEEIWPLAEPIAPYAYIETVPEIVAEDLMKKEK